RKLQPPAKLHNTPMKSAAQRKPRPRAKPHNGLKKSAEPRKPRPSAKPHNGLKKSTAPRKLQPAKLSNALKTNVARRQPANETNHASMISGQQVTLNQYARI